MALTFSKPPTSLHLKPIIIRHHFRIPSFSYWNSPYTTCTWSGHCNTHSKNNVLAFNRFSWRTRHHYILPLPSLSLRFQVFPPPSPFRFLFQFCPHRSMTSQSQSSDSSDSSLTKTVRAVIKGRVQGVFYRNWTIENATQLGLKGWVRNRHDGSVEALFSGKPEAVDEMEQRCRRGPPAAMVTGLQIFPSADDPGSGFERKPTV